MEGHLYAEELSTLVREKTGIDFGLIIDLEPVTRAPPTHNQASRKR